MSLKKVAPAHMTPEEASLKTAWELLALLGELMLLSGIVGEGLEIASKISKLRNAGREKPTRFHLWTIKHELKIEIFGLMCWLLIALGLAIELAGNHKSKGIADRENVRLNILASQANERATSNEVERAKLEIRLGVVETNQTPRHLSEAQKSALTSGFSQMEKFPVILAFNPDDPECVDFKDEIGACLRAANVQWHSMSAVVSEFPRGISLWTSNSPVDSVETLQLKRALASAGLRAVNRQRPHKNAAVIICVGPK